MTVDEIKNLILQCRADYQTICNSYVGDELIAQLKLLHAVFESDVLPLTSDQAFFAVKDISPFYEENNLLPFIGEE